MAKIHAGQKARRSTPKGAVGGRPIELELLEILSLIEDLLPEGPSSTRVRLRDMRARLLGYANASESDVAQQLAEEDGDPVEPE